MKLTKLASIITLATLAAAAPRPEKRCRVGSAVQPCWVRWDLSECEVYKPVGVKYNIDKEHNQITVTGLCESCGRALALEQQQKLSGSWATHFGTVEDLGNGTFVISNATKYALEFHEWVGENTFPHSWGTSCVHVEGDPDPE